MFDASLLENSQHSNKVNIPVAILKVGKEKHRRECHDPSATQQQGQEENHPSVNERIEIIAAHLHSIDNIDYPARVKGKKPGFEDVAPKPWVGK